RDRQAHACRSPSSSGAGLLQAKRRLMTSELPSIARAAHDIREGLLRPIDLVEHCLERIEQLESKVRAWVFVDSAGARREAQRLGKVQQADEDLGPLHGIPVAIKDII